MNSNKKKIVLKVKSNESNDEIVKLDHRSHILKLPDTYVGSMDMGTEEMWCLNSENKFEKRNVNYIPGEYKIFDEIIVNAIDQYVKTHENTNCTIRLKYKN